MSDYIQVMTTTGSMTDAQRIADVIVGQRLAACVQIIGPIRSTYWWEGEVKQDEEYLCLIKTRGDVYEQLEQAIREAHSYDEPEILAIPVLRGSQGYLDWLDREVGQHDSK